MTEEDKQLLLKDLCARIPYEVIVDYPDCYGGGWDTVVGVQFDEVQVLYNGRCVPIEQCKPYLRPISSMTEEERLYFHRNASRVPILVDEEKSMVKEFWGYTTHLFDWLLEHHFDYRGLIEKGLALEAPEGIYKTE